MLSTSTSRLPALTRRLLMRRQLAKASRPTPPGRRSAPRAPPPAHQAEAAGKVQPLDPARRQQAPLGEASGVTGPGGVGRKLKVLPACHQLVQGDGEIEVLLVRHQLQAPREQT